jgi:hypothetical protein
MWNLLNILARWLYLTRVVVEARLLLVHGRHTTHSVRHHRTALVRGIEHVRVVAGGLRTKVSIDWLTLTMLGPILTIVILSRLTREPVSIWPYIPRQAALSLAILAITLPALHLVLCSAIRVHHEVDWYCWHVMLHVLFQSGIRK